MSSFLKEILWVVPGAFIVVASHVGFNKPPTNRSSTTFALFYCGMLVYYTLLLGIWLFIIVLLSKSGAKIVGESFRQSELADFIPAVAALMVVTGSKIEAVSKFDTPARQLCLHLASIPLQADLLALELSNRALFRIPGKMVKAQVSEHIQTNIGKRALNFRDDGSASSRFTRAVSLYWLFIVPYKNGTPLDFPTSAISSSAYTKVMKFGERVIAQADRHFETLIETAIAYFTAAQPVRQLEETLHRAASETSTAVCSLIARYVLIQDRGNARRHNRLLKMGFSSYKQEVAFGIDQLVASVLAITAITVVIVSLTPRSNPLGPSDAFLIALIYALQLGISIVAGTFVGDRFIQRNEGFTEFRFPPLFELLVAALIVLVISAALRIGVPLFPTILGTSNLSLAESVSEFVNKRWAGVIAPFASTISIGLLCSYLPTLPWGRIRVVTIGAICNGIAFTAAAGLIAWFLPGSVLEDLGRGSVGIGRLVVVITSGAIGLAVGAMVLGMFRKSLPRGEAALLAESLKDAGADEFFGEVSRGTMGKWARKELGGYSRDIVAGLEGRYVCFRPVFSKPSVIISYIVEVQWSLEESCLVFQEEFRPDVAYTQRGQIYIPDGRPFMNLVTISNGALRLMMLSRLDSEGLARGLVVTLSNPGGMHFTPAAAPVVLRRLGEQVPRLGYVQPGMPDYELFEKQLLSVTPSFGFFSQLNGLTS